MPKRIRKPSHPGDILKSHYLEPRGVSQKRFADSIELSEKQLSQVINGHRRLEPDVAVRLAKALETTTDFWLNLQKARDVWDAEEMHVMPAQFQSTVCCIDLEASSLGPDGWPTEVGWAFPGGMSGGTLIKPPTAWIGCELRDFHNRWTGWSHESEAVTGITQDMLIRNGETPERAAKRFMHFTHGAKYYSDAPEFDLVWLRKLLDAGGVDDEIELHDFESLYAEIARAENHPNLSEAIYRAEQECPKTHRAEQDAKHLAFIYKLIAP